MSGRVFISYSRKDLEEAQTLRDALIGAGFDAYLDLHDIAPGEPWKDRLGALIASAEKLVFLISPGSVASDICDWEVNEAERQGKPILPVVVRETAAEAIPPRLARLHFIFWRAEDDRGAAIAALAGALATDLAWERERTRINDLAQAWAATGRSRRRLTLRAEPLREMEAWRDARPTGAAAPTELQAAFISESRRALSRRQRRVAADSLVGAAAAALLAAGALFQSVVAERNAAEAQRQRAIAEAKAAEAERNFATAEQAVRALVIDIARGLSDTEGMSLTAAEKILNTAEASLEQLLAEDPDNERLRALKFEATLEFARVYVKLGDSDASRRLSEDLPNLFSGENADMDSAAMQAAMAGGLETMLPEVGRLNVSRRLAELVAAQGVFTQVVENAEALLAQGSADQNTRASAFGARFILARLALAREAHAEALEHLARAERTLALWPEGAPKTLQTALLERSRGDAHMGEDRVDAAASAYATTLALTEALVAAEPTNVAYRADLGGVLRRIGDVWWLKGDDAKAAAHLRRAITQSGSVLAAQPANRLERRALIDRLYRLSFSAAPQEARDALLRARKLAEEIAQNAPPSDDAQGRIQLIDERLSQFEQ